MFALDLRSLTLMAFMTSVTMGFVLLMLRRHYPGSIRGMWLWGLAPLTAAASTPFFGFEALLPPLVVVLAGNGLLMAGFALFYFGSRRFHGLRSGWRPWAVVGLLALAWHAWFLLVQPDYRLRLGAFGATLAVLLALHVQLLLREGRGFAARFTAGVLTVQMLVLVARAASTYWLDSADTHRFAPSPVQAVYVATYSFSVLLVSVGVLLMASERLRSEFEHQANHDSLTGTLSRRVLLQDGSLEFARWQRHRHGFAVLMLDLDCFKQVNDAHGHQIGDRVLQRVVQAIGQPLRSVDRLGRYGGEEFLVLLPQTDAAGAQRVAERMRQAVQEQPAGNGLPACTVSVGVAAVAPGDDSLHAVLTRADAALYRAKDAGRNRVEVAGDV